MASPKKQTRRLLTGGFFVLTVLFGLLFFFQEYIRHELSLQIKERLQRALPKDYSLDYETLTIDWSAQSVELAAFNLNREKSSPKLPLEKCVFFRLLPPLASTIVYTRRAPILS